MNRYLLIFLDKTLFRLIFHFIALLSKLQSRKRIGHYPVLSGSESFLVIRPGGLGDGIMTIPFLKALRKKFPKNRITLLCVKKNKLAFQHLPYIDDILVFDSMRDFHKNILSMFKCRFDIVFDLEPFRKVSSIIAYLSRAHIRVGFDTNRRRTLYTHYVSYANEKNYESLNMIRQLEVLGVNIQQNEAIDISFTLPEEFAKKGKTILRSHDIDPEKDFITVIVPGVLKAHHRWVMTKFASLINMILKEDSKAKILLMGSPSDISDVHEVMQHITKSKRVVNLVGETNFENALGVLKTCKILIACDGGIVYMAAAMGCNTISIWGPGVMERFKPPGDNHIGVRKDYFCVPCVNYSRLGEFPDCPYDRKCIKDISAMDVFDKYKNLKTRILDKQYNSKDKKYSTASLQVARLEK